MGMNMGQTLRAKGASDLLLCLLREQHLLNRRQLNVVAMRSLRGIGPSAPPSATIQDGSIEKAAPSFKAGRRPRLQSIKAPSSHIQVLAALALSYL